MARPIVNRQALRLVAPCHELRRSFTEAIEEYRDHRVIDFSYPEVEDDEDFLYFLKRCEDRRAGWNIPKGYVPNSSFWLTDGRQYLGSGDIRHFLNESLKGYGGHIGYSIRPSAWGMGLGTVQLGLLLAEARHLHIKVARLTCFDDNVGSYRIMEKNGAVLINKTYNHVAGAKRLTRIYEIDLSHWESV